MRAYGAEEEAAETSKEEKSESHREAKGNPAGLFALVLAFLIPACIFTVFPQYFLPGMAESFGHTAVAAGALQSIAMASNMIAKLVFGFLSDRIGAGKTTVAFSLLGMASILLMIPLRNAVPALYVLTFVMGLCFIFPSLGEIFIVREAFGTENYAKFYPVIDTILSISMALGNTLIGVLVDLAGSYIPVMMLLALFMAVASAAAALVYGRKTVRAEKNLRPLRG